jgi:hypothetical protein
MWNKQQTATFQKALAAMDGLEAAISHLQEIAKVAPQFADRIDDLALRAENVRTLSTVALSAVINDGTK